MATVLPTVQLKVTYMERWLRQEIEDITIAPYQWKKIENISYKQYIELYREIGRNYIWNYRAGQDRKTVEEILQSSDFLLFLMYQEDKAIAMAECNIESDTDVEIVHFGLIPEFLGQGIGARLLQKLLGSLSGMHFQRVHLSTCEWDHPKAINFYQSFGFKIYDSKSATFTDYRYSGFYSKEDAPQIPLSANSAL